MMTKHKEVDLTERPFLKKMIIYVIPLVFTGLLQCLYNAADLVVVGSFKGPGALAAVGTTGALTNLVLGLFMGLSVGAGVVVAQHIGALEYKKVERVVHSAILLAAVLGVVVGVIGFIFSGTFLSWMDVKNSEEYKTLNHATLYLRIIFCGVPASFIYNYCTSIVNATGETKKPLIILAISGAVNVILNLILVVGFDRGVDGVAIGTIASQYLSAILILIYMMRVDNCIKFSFKKLCFDWGGVKKMLVIGIPSGIQGVLFSLSNVLIQSSVNGFGDPVMAGAAAAANLEGFCYVATNSVYRAALTFSGQNMGAKKYKNIKLIAIQAVLCSTVIAIVCTGIIMLFRDFFVGLYIADDTPKDVLKDTIEAAMTRIFCMFPLYFLLGIMEAMCGIIRGMGKSIITMIFSLTGACFFRILWLQTAFKYVNVLHSPAGIFISYPISWFMVAALEVIYFIYLYRKLTRGSRVDSLIHKIKTHSYNK